MNQMIQPNTVGVDGKYDLDGDLRPFWTTLGVTDKDGSVETRGEASDCELPEEVDNDLEDIVEQGTTDI